MKQKKEMDEHRQEVDQLKDNTDKSIEECWKNSEKALEEMNNAIYDNNKFCSLEYGKLFELLKDLDQRVSKGVSIEATNQANINLIEATQANINLLEANL